MKKIINLKTGLSLIGAVLLLAPVWAAACSNLGPDKHMGIVTLVDPLKGTLSLMDAETQKTIAFVTGEELLKKVHVNDRIVVTFETDKDQHVAKEIVVHASKKGVSTGG